MTSRSTSFPNAFLLWYSALMVLGGVYLTEAFREVILGL